MPLAVLILAESDNAQTWALLILLITVVIAAVTAWIKSLIAASKAQAAEIRDLKDQSAKARHETVVKKLDGIGSEVTSLRGEVHTVKQDVDDLKPRVASIEHRLRPEGGR